jgi:hypothetical protein
MDPYYGPGQPPEVPLPGELTPQRRFLRFRRTSIARSGQTVYFQQINYVSRQDNYYGDSGGRRQHRLGKAALVVGILCALIAIGDWLGPFAKVATWCRNWSADHFWLSWLAFAAILTLAAIAIAWITDAKEIGSIGPLAFAALGVAKAITMGWFDFLIVIGRGLAAAGRWLAGAPTHHPWLTATTLLATAALTGFIIGINARTTNREDAGFGTTAISLATLVLLGFARAIVAGWFDFVVDFGLWIGRQAHASPWTFGAIAVAVAIIIGISISTAQTNRSVRRRRAIR